ncbi:hypothetical protein [Sphingomonas humi]|uniref:Uncharacterized protein n=1 Tax=Sphingomonas humi TaxID=335630 RepID=A0ABP7RIC9_9SPHN
MSLLSDVIASAVTAFLNDGLKRRGEPAYIGFALLPFLFFFALYFFVYR